LTSALAGDEWSDSHPCRSTPGERARGTHWIGGWVDPRAGLDDMEKIKFLTLTRLRPLSRPASSQSLYRLCYPGSRNWLIYSNIAQAEIWIQKVLLPIYFGHWVTKVYLLFSR
jgi:hypothetical protein